MKKKIFLLSAALSAVMFIAACSASQIQQVESLLSIAVDAVPSIITLLGGSQAAVNFANAAKSDLDLSKTLIAGYEANAPSAATTLQRVNALLQDAKSNLSGIISAIPATDAHRQKISAVTTAILGVTQDIIADLPSATGKATLARPARLPKPSDFKKEINHLLSYIGASPMPVPPYRSQAA